MIRSTAALAFTKAAAAAGRNAGPALLFDWWYGGRLTTEELHAVIGDVWVSAEWPAAALGQRQWVEFFRIAGFVADDGRPMPTEPMKVYRGSTWGRRRGMSWSEDREQAEWFANRWTARGRTALVLETLVEPAAVLALLSDKDGRAESEVVVDPAMLRPIRRPAGAA
jgi:hypothetical protein